MMDAVLVENFHAVHRQRLTGVLRVEGAGITQRFAFQQGDPVAVDFGVDKDRLLADALLRYHRVTPEFHQAAVAVYLAGHASVGETALRHQAASEEEIARTTQSMVEDALCRVFSEQNRGVFFDEGVEVDSLDFDRRAFRLRIDAELLLRTIGQRIDEMRALAAADPTWAMVYALAEAAPSSELSPFEKLVLNFVDGQRTVAELAEACRDSSAGLARILSSLAAKGIVRQTGGRTPSSAVSVVADPRAPSGAHPRVMEVSRVERDPPARESMAGQVASGEFVPVRRREDPPSQFPLRTVLMAGALAATVAVGWLVLDYESRRRAFRETTERIVELLARTEWQAALSLVGEADGQAGGDLEAKRQVEELRGMVNRALARERQVIGDLLTVGDFAAARQRLRSYPEGVDLESLRQRMVEAERQFDIRSRALVAEVEEMLRRGDVLSAVSACSADADGRLSREREAAREALDRWRAARLDEAAVTGSSIRSRRYALERLRAAAPSVGQVETADRLQRQIDQQARVVSGQVRQLAERLARGQVEEIAGDLERLRIVEQAAGSELDAEMGRLRQELDRRRLEITDYKRSALEGLRDPSLVVRLPILAEKGDALARASEGATAGMLSSLSALLHAVIEVPDDLPPEVRAERTAALANGRDLPADVAAALAERADLLRRIESRAEDELQHARRVRRDGDLQRARELLVVIGARSDLRRTEASKRAEAELAEVDAAIARRIALKADLERAIAAGDVAAAGGLSREMGLPYLPLVVDSIPRGAAVQRAGKEIGRTPLMLDIPAAERVDADFAVSVPGYRLAQVRGSQAEGGWRLLVRLERQPAALAAIHQGITSHPVALGSRVVAASRLGVAMVTAAGVATYRSFNESAVEDPIYGRAIADGDLILVPTRNRLVLQIGPSGIQRIPLAVSTDEGLAVYHSDLVVGRRLLLVAGTDGRLHAGDGISSQALWQGRPGAAFVAAPVVTGDRVRVARRDGILETYGVEDGQMIEVQQLGAAILAAWPTANGLEGVTGSDAWSWSGGSQVLRSLPFVATQAGQGVIVSSSGRVAVLAAGGDWREVGRLDGEIRSTPVAWRGHAVIPQGHVLTVLGERGFTLRGAADFLPGALLGDRLVVVDQAGAVAIFAP